MLLTGPISLVTALAASTWLTFCLVVLGAAVRLLWQRPGWPAGGLSVVAGQGAATAMLLCSLSWRITGEVDAGLLALVCIVLAGTTQAVLRTRAAAHPARTVLEGLAPNRFDLVAMAIAAACVLAPLLREGWASWNPYSDLPSYIGSAYQWLDPTGFAATHSDYFGQGIAWRASFEKPMVTGLFVVASSAGVPPWLAFAPIMVVALFIMTGSAMSAISSSIRPTGYVGAAAVTVTTMSAVPMSRFHEASIGQVLGAAMCANLIATFLGHAHGWAGAIRAGAVAAVAMGANFTLVLGFSLVLVAQILWLDTRRGSPAGRTLAQVSRSIVIMVVMLIPFASSLAQSASIQATGDQGYRLPLTSPLAVLGLWPAPQLGLPNPVTIAMWVIAIVATLWARRTSGAGPLSAPARLLVASSLSTTTLLALRFGPSNYIVLKIIALQIWVLAPFALAAALSWPRVAPSARRLVRPVAVVSIALGVAYPLYTSPLEVDGAELHSPVLAALPSINIALTDERDSAFAGVTIPSESVVVTDTNLLVAFPARTRAIPCAIERTCQSAMADRHASRRHVWSCHPPLRRRVRTTAVRRQQYPGVRVVVWRLGQAEVGPDGGLEAMPPAPCD